MGISYVPTLTLISAEISRNFGSYKHWRHQSRTPTTNYHSISLVFLPQLTSIVFPCRSNTPRNTLKRHKTKTEEGSEEPDRTEITHHQTRYTPIKLLSIDTYVYWKLGVLFLLIISDWATPLFSHDLVGVNHITHPSFSQVLRSSWRYTCGGVEMMLVLEGSRSHR